MGMTIPRVENPRFVFRQYGQHLVVVLFDNNYNELGIIAHCDNLAECRQEVAEYLANN